ncbi:MAG: Spy/CpxP family protein refolding chaperone, partial [Phycisphaerales bacterium]|nr:Spy/CpxP family protein refolding chaperone [Phycisphaerales bacterium]
MTRIKLLIVFLFVVALGTGFLVGLGVAKSKSAADAMPGGGVVPERRGGQRPPPPQRPPLTEALSLTPAQNEQLRVIWSDWDPSRQTRSERHPQFQKERDDAIQALLSDSQKAAFDDIQKKYRQLLDQLDEERRQAFQVAVDKTKAILNDEQRAKYDDILKNAPPGRGPRGGGDR